MQKSLIFLSHIHEEKELAKLIKEAIESEFAGFVDVFVSSDGTSIPAGSNFLKRIEDGLLNCIGALYLISPLSVKRNWINFELGAVWIRNASSLRERGAEIPVVPICHSDMTLNALPQPIGNLNAVIANNASQLEFAFRSLQSAVGGKGALRTNFDLLAQNIRDFERLYTTGSTLKRFFAMLGGDPSAIVKHCESLAPGVHTTTLELGFIPTDLIRKIRDLQSNELSGNIELKTTNPGLTFGPQGAVNGAETSVNIDVQLVLDFKKELLA